MTIKVNRKIYKFILIKSYFDKGYGWTTYPKWILATIGIGTLAKGAPVHYIVAGGIIYGICCFILGYILFKTGVVLAEHEVGNQFNALAKELRNKFTIPKSLNR